MNQPSSPSSSSAAHAGAVDPASFWRRSALAAGVVGLLAIGVLAGVLWQRSPPPPDVATTAPAVAAAATSTGTALPSAPAASMPGAAAVGADSPNATRPPGATSAGKPAAATSELPAAPAAPVAAAPAAPPAPKVCANCGVVEAVSAVTQKGEGSGLGAVAGGVLGGVIGHQMGGGSGKTAMTVIGAVGGGLAGNEVEKRQKSSTQYQVTVRMDDGSKRSFSRTQAPAVGARVRIENDQLVLDSARP